MREGRVVVHEDLWQVYPRGMTFSSYPRLRAGLPALGMGSMFSCPCTQRFPAFDICIQFNF